ncbi:uncharacterized protein LOC129584115 [Paramacrobiotus metropolitanus]|uniref:uncharacterized protein LOC129584115 n=1 Tax=Paramacrobiotus metropolitanus TaxID=2943436 RepID=UPI0024460F47|nr:uncharacterized protein LOC129584115 [Paramacrobiotus metropolitanus]
MRRCGFLTTHEKDTSPTRCQKHSHGLLYTVRTGFLVLVWIWTAIMTINIFYRAIISSGHSSQGSPTHNTIIELLEESPYSLITVRCSLILSIFMANAPKLVEAVHECAQLQAKILLSGGNISLYKFRHRPKLFIYTTIIVILSWEAYEWSVWFSTNGINAKWDLSPLPVVIRHWHYAICWSVFTTIPFILSQLVLCFPVFFAYVLRKLCRYVNKELAKLAEVAKLADNVEEDRVQCGQRLSGLRAAHYDINKTFNKVHNAVAPLLLIQFMADVIVLFGFLGLLVNSRNKNPPVPTLEWVLYVLSSLLWFFFFLFHFSFPLIHMAEEAERSHQLVHSLTFASPKLFKERFDDIRTFLNELRGHTLVFTGGHFYYLNRHYIVTCVALTASYLTILSEILDRYYSTEEIKATMSNIASMLKNATNAGFVIPLSALKSAASVLEHKDEL